MDHGTVKVVLAVFLLFLGAITTSDVATPEDKPPTAYVPPTEFFDQIIASIVNLNTIDLEKTNQLFANNAAETLAQLAFVNRFDIEPFLNDVRARDSKIWQSLTEAVTVYENYVNEFGPAISTMVERDLPSSWLPNPLVQYFLQDIVKLADQSYRLSLESTQQRSAEASAQLDVFMAEMRRLAGSWEQFDEAKYQIQVLNLWNLASESSITTLNVLWTDTFALTTNTEKTIRMRVKLLLDYTDSYVKDDY